MLAHAGHGGLLLREFTTHTILCDDIRFGNIQKGQKIQRKGEQSTHRNGIILSWFMGNVSQIPSISWYI